VSSGVVIGLDIGGTKILTGRLDEEGHILARDEVASPTTSGDAVLQALDRAVEAMLDERVKAIGYGIASNLDRRTGRILHATNLPLVDVDLAAHARDRFGLPVGVENDANAAALAEWRLGAGREVENLVMLTLGTGVGGGVVVDGRLFRQWAELGHIVVVAGGPPCQGACHGRGHLEAVASGHAADRAAKALYGEDADAHLLVERCRAGDDASRERLAEIGNLLGVAIGSLVNVFDPELVIVGGGFGEAAGEFLLGPARESARREAIAPADETLRIVPAELGTDAGLHGAGLVALEALSGER
jgi:glucokinase